MRVNFHLLTKEKRGREGGIGTLLTKSSAPRSSLDSTSACGVAVISALDLGNGTGNAGMTALGAPTPGSVELQQLMHTQMELHGTPA